MRLTKSVAVEAAKKNLEKRELLFDKAAEKVVAAKARLEKAILANTPKAEKATSEEVA
jgi:hypothetical protein